MTSQFSERGVRLSVKMYIEEVEDIIELG